MSKAFKNGSLFDGSGGFPLAATLCGGTPVWASEVEPYPIAVTRSRFPNMKHLGSVTEINGAEIEPVDVITFGSPCQDLSVAGKRAGLKHEANGDEETTRSGLFMEAVRIIKEMRKATNGRYPTFALWENVPGAFSSNKGEDFRIVLEELIKIAEPGASMPAVPQKGWAYADRYCGDGWSIAYRVLDAQYWGVPQRRRRIYLVLDLGGQRAGKVLFEREGLRGHFAESGTQREAVAEYAQDCSGADGRAGEGFDGYNGDLTGAVSATLGVNCGVSTGRNGVVECRRGLVAVAYSFDSLASNSMKSSNPHSGCRQVEVSKCLDTTDPNPSKNQGGIAIVEAAGFKAGQGAKARSIGYEEERAPTLASEAGGNSVPSVCVKTYDARGNGDVNTVSIITGDHENRITDYTSVVVEKMPVFCLQGNGIDRADTAGCNGKGWNDKSCYTLNTIDRHAVAYAIGNGQLNQISMSNVGNTLDCMHDKQAVLVEDVAGIDCRNFNENPELYPTLQAKPNGGQSLNFSHAVRVRYIVRRLTPTECARLQGFPDNWAHPDVKTELTDEEYRLWLNVRNTHAAINDKAVKEYTKEQMLKWYNGLHTDSAEYKMWGNGIALPTALYCMQGIAEAME